MITVESISKHFGTVKAVDDITFEVKPGEILGLLGPNGAGKTTTLRLIAGYLRADQGVINVGEFNADEQALTIREKIGYLPEYNPLYQDMLVFDYLHYIADMRGIPATAQPARVKDMVAICGLGEVIHKKVGELSKGNRQRVGLAQAMIHDPEYLILDEPTAGLDPNQIIEIRDLIKKIGKEKTVILSSHILSEVEATCDRVVIIHQGKKVADGRPNELQKTAVDEAVIHLKIKGKDVAAKLANLDGIREVKSGKDEDHEVKGYVLNTETEEDMRPEVFRLACQEGWILYEMTREVHSLETIFRRLTAN